MIQFINVNKKLGDHTILENINFDIKPGSIVGVMGVNGAGKSTLLRLMAGVIEADAGLVVVNERNIFENELVKKDLLFLSDDPYFFSQSTLNDLRMFYKIFYESFNDDMYFELVKKFNLDPTKKLQDLSKGTMRQAALVAAVASQPKILLLDEAFDGLDPKKRFLLRQTMSEYMNLEDSIIVVSSHNLMELEEICDTIILVENRSLKLNQQTHDFRALYHKFQLAFSTPIDPSSFDHLKPLSVVGDKQIYTVVVKGDVIALEEALLALEPAIIEHHFMTLDDIFMHETEGDIA